MKVLLSTLKKTFFWSYERGSWQYDILCVVILLFIFFGPNSIFHSRQSMVAERTTHGAIFVDHSEIGQVAPERLHDRVREQLSAKLGRPVSIQRIERVRDEAGNLKGYMAWEELSE